MVSATRTYTQKDVWVDVNTYVHFGHRTFLASDVPQARISPSDILTIFPTSDIIRRPTKGMLELPAQAFAEFLELSARTQRKYEKLFSIWAAG